MTTTVLGVLFLGVSAVSLLIQVAALRRLYRWPEIGGHTQNVVYRGLLRTSACRVLAAMLYVAMGIATLLARSTLPVVALSVFTAVQILWQANAFADVRLRRDLAASDRVKSEDTEQ
jgi:hypothetical protein